MKPVFNKETNANEITVPATLKRVGADQHKTATKETPYVWAECEISYPDGSTDTIDALLWQALLDSTAKDAFKPDRPVSITITVDGDNAGFAKVSLPTIRKVNLSKFGIGTTTAADAVTEQEEVQANV